MLSSSGSQSLSSKQLQFLQRIRATAETRKSYESIELQGKALSKIPIERLWKKIDEDVSKSSESVPYHLDPERFFLLKHLVHWFKTDFFKWVDSPPCSACGSTDGKFKGMGTATSEHTRWGAHRVEVHACNKCGNETSFPRYNAAEKLLSTRTGRCGEWANCFSLCVRAMGFEVRYISDWTDHVWCEVWVDCVNEAVGGAGGRWLHCDACEDSVDEPLKYEAGWGKKLHMIVGVGRDEVVDVVQRYTRQTEEVFRRRREELELDDDWVALAICELDFQMESWNTSQGLDDRFSQLRDQRRLQERLQLEGLERAVAGETLKTGEQVGRESGSDDWKASRSENGLEVGSGKDGTLEWIKGIARLEPNPRGTTPVVVNVSLSPYNLAMLGSERTLETTCADQQLEISLGPCIVTDKFPLVVTSGQWSEPLVVEWKLVNSKSQSS